MGLNSNIGWTDHTLNIWTGCTKVSAGCKYCYMFRGQERWGKDPTELVSVSDRTINSILSKAQPGETIFINSWSDFCIDDRKADEWRAKTWDIIRSRPDLIFQILTKRPDNIFNCLPDDWGKEGYSNVWFGTSIENNAELHRLQSIFDALHNSEKKYKIFLSLEPLLERLDFINDSVVTAHLFETCVDWVIIGGESGNKTGKYKYRPCNIEWILDLVAQCRVSNIPVFVKQLGSDLADRMQLQRKTGDDVSEFPEALKYQQFPKH